MTEHVSIVICTRDRVGGLEATLDRYAVLQHDPDWDLVIVDDGSRDGTADLLARRTAGGRRFTVVTTAGVGLGAARNVGWRAAAGPLILFTDDDCYPDPSLLDEVRRCMAGQGIHFIGGRLLPFTPADAAVAVVMRSSHVPVPPRSFVPAGLLPGANLTIRRSALDAVGGFDPEFGAGTPFPAEDVELVARLAANGFSGAFDPGPVIYHHHDRRSDESVERLRRLYDRGRGAYYAKCLADPRVRSVYLRAWLRLTRTGSWRRAGRELAGAVAYWTR
ncbi:MAG: glycosyltransferase family 2 protein [Gemmatimonadales bacterium]